VQHWGIYLPIISIRLFYSELRIIAPKRIAKIIWLHSLYMLYNDLAILNYVELRYFLHFLLFIEF